MTGFPLDQLGRWPGRFRSARLVRALAEGNRLDADLAAKAVLSGLVDDHDERQVFDGLLAAGEFGAAEWMLDECPVLDDGTGPESTGGRLERTRDEARQDLTARLTELTQRAEIAGIAIEDGLGPELDALCLTSGPRAEERLAAVEGEFGERAADKAGRLRERLQAADDLDPGYREGIEAHIEDGFLDTAEHILGGTETGQLPGPQSVRRLPPLEWKAPADEILRWHLERNGGPASFRPVADEKARNLLGAYDALRQGGESNAKEFARALDAFLHDSDQAAYRVTPEGEVFLTHLHHVFFDPHTTRFAPSSRVRLLVAGPGVTDVPEDLTERLTQPFIAVGPSLIKPGLRGRRKAAVVTLEDLLRLVLNRNHRPVALLRILGRQWPTAALARDSAADLERLLGADKQDRRLTLWWLVDLCGLGDTTVADAIEFGTGLDSALIRVFLDYLDRRQDPDRADSGAMRDIARKWHADKQMSAAVEQAVLTGLRDVREAPVTFWSALTVPLGQPVTMRELATEAKHATSAGRRTGDEVPVNWEDEITAGAAELGRLWLISSDGEGSERRLTLTKCGVYDRLARIADRRLKHACETRAEQLRQIDRDHNRELEVQVQASHRHALIRLRAEHAKLSRDLDTPQEEITAKREAIDRETARILNDDGMAGPCDLGKVLAELQEVFPGMHRSVSIALEGTAGAAVAVGRVLVRTMLYELFANAAEAMTELGGGEIEVTVEAASAEEVLIHIRDQGDGIRPEVQHKIFRDGTSTRGANRGFGLYNARGIADRVRGALELVEPRTEDPQLPGAHFLLSLPRN